MNRKKSRVKKPIYTVRNALRPQVKNSDELSAGEKFYQKNYVMIWVVVIFFIVPLFIWVWGSCLGKSDSAPGPVSILPLAQLERLHDRYPEGYRLFEISGGKMIPLKPDTFPEKFRANWSYSKVSFKNDKNEIKIYLPDIYYEPGHFRFVALNSTISKTKDFMFGLLRSDTSELIVEIIEDPGDKLICILGIRSIGNVE